MKTEEEKFDDFLKQRLGNETVPFKEQYWENARTMLEANRPKRKRYGFLLFMSALLIAGISAVLFNHENNLVSNHQPGASDGVVKQEAHKHIPAAGAEYKNAGGGRMEILLASNEPQQVNTPANSTTSTTTFNQEAVDEASDLRQLELNKQHFTGEKNNEEVQDAGSALQVEGINLATHAGETDAAIYGNAHAEQVLAYATPPALLVEPRWKTALDISGYQASAASNPKRASGKRSSFKMLELGVNYYNPGQSTFENINVHAGIKYGIAVAPRLFLVSGISYSRQHFSEGKRNYNTISYGFGEKRETKGINTIRLDYVEIPLGLFYTVKSRHGLTGGVSFNYLLQSSDLIKPKDQSTFSEKSSGHFAAFNRFDIQLHAGYTYALNSRVLLSAAYYAGVMDVTKNASFKSPAITTNKGFRFTIGYQLY